MKVIFLDIDGVLNDHKAWPNRCGRICYERVEHLNKVLCAVPDAKIVLSSAWRYSFPEANTIMALLMAHGCDCLHRVHGATDLDPVLENRPAWTERAEWNRLGKVWRKQQILDYVERHEITAWVVIDDLALDLPNLVLTDCDIGLTAEKAVEAVEILNKGEKNEPRVTEAKE